MFTWIFSSIWVPTGLHFTFPNPPKSFKNPTPRTIKILIDFCIDFFSIRAPFWAPSWSHVGHLVRAKTPQGRSQDAPRTVTRRPKTPQDTPKTPPRRPKPSPDDDSGRILGTFWKIWGGFLEDFWEEFPVQHASSNLLSKSRLRS